MSPASITPLRRRMIEDMSTRQFGDKTQRDYVRVVADFARFLGRSPDHAEPEDLRRYQLHLATQGASPAKMNAAVSALRFFFKVTLSRRGYGERLATVRKEDRLPQMLSPRKWRCCSQGESGPYWLSLFAVTEWSGGEPTNCSDDHAAIGWFSSEEISKLTNLANLDYVQLSRMALRPIAVRPRDDV